MRAFIKLKIDNEEKIYEYMLKFNGLSIQDGQIIFFEVTGIPIGYTKSNFFRKESYHSWQLKNIIEFKMLSNNTILEGE